MLILRSQFQEPGKGPVPLSHIHDHLTARRIPEAILGHELQGPGEVGGVLLRLRAGRVETTALEADRNIERPPRDGLGERCLGVALASQSQQGAGAGRRFETEEDRIEPAVAARIGWATQLIQRLVALSPGHRIEDMNGTLLIPLEAGDDADPGREARWVVWQLGSIPEPRRPVLARGQDGLAVGAESHSVDALSMAAEGLTDRLTGAGVPEPRRGVEATCQDGLAVGAE